MMLKANKKLQVIAYVHKNILTQSIKHFINLVRENIFFTYHYFNPKIPITAMGKL